MKKIAFISMLTLAAANAHASINDNIKLSTLDLARKQTIQLYLSALQSGNPSIMSSIFTSAGTVRSTSVGEAPAVQFFNSFLPKIKSAELSVGNIYKSVSSDDKFGATFSYHWTLKDGSKGGGSYADEFIFAKASSKLSHVTMYENLQATIQL